MRRILLLFFAIVSASYIYSQSNLQEGQLCFDNGDYTCAETKYNDALRSVSGKDKQLIEIRLTQVKWCIEHLNIANKAFIEENYQKAEESYKSVLESNPKDEYAKAQLEKCRNIFNSQTYLKDGDGCFNKGDYACADTKYSEAITLVSGRDEQLIEIKLIRTKNCLEWTKTANQLFANKNYSVAKENYQKVLDANPKDEYAKAQLEKCNNNLNPPTVTLSVSKDNLSFSSSGGSQNITVTTTAGSYSVNALPSWCTVQKQAGYFVVTCTANSGSTDRTGNFTITAGNKTIRINVSQSGEKAKPETTLRVTNDNLSFPSSGGNSEEIKVYSNAGNYSISLLPSWCTVKTYNGYFVISCSANYTGQARYSSFQVNAGEKNIKITVNQDARVTQSSNYSSTSSYRKSYNCFNCPKSKNTWGLTLGYTQNSYMDGIQFGLRVEPLFKYGFGLNTGLIFEGYSTDLMSIFEGEEEFDLYAFNIPLHLEYRLNFSKWINVFFYGGANFNILTDPSFNDYTFPTTFEYGGGVRFNHIQLNVGKSLFIGDFKDIKNFGKYATPYQDLIISVSYMF